MFKNASAAPAPCPLDCSWGVNVACEVRSTPVVPSRRCVWLSARLSSSSRRGHLVGIASAAVTRCVSGDRLLITTVRDLSFFPVSGLQDNFGTLYRFNSPNKRVKINKLVVEALYRDGLIPFTSLNALRPITSKPSNIVIRGNFHHFLKEEMTKCSAFRPPGFTKRMKRHFPNSITKDLLGGEVCSVNSCTITNIRDIYFWFCCWPLWQQIASQVFFILWYSRLKTGFRLCRSRVYWFL